LPDAVRRPGPGVRRDPAGRLHSVARTATGGRSPADRRRPAAEYRPSVRPGRPGAWRALPAGVALDLGAHPHPADPGGGPGLPDRTRLDARLAAEPRADAQRAHQPAAVPARPPELADRRRATGRGPDARPGAATQQPAGQPP